MAATKRFMNWTGVSFTPSGGSLLTYTGVTNVAIDLGGSLAKFSGDGDRYNTTVVNDFNDPSITVTSADLTALRTNPVGTVGAFSATHNDAKNLVTASGGAITYALANAVVSTVQVGGAHRQFGQGTIGFDTFSSDGVTSPLTYTAL